MRNDDRLTQDFFQQWLLAGFPLRLVFSSRKEVMYELQTVCVQAHSRRQNLIVVVLRSMIKRLRSLWQVNLIMSNVGMDSRKVRECLLLKKQTG